MEAWHALLYGLIQGISEFLPVSSSGHLALLPHFFSIEDPGVIFDLMMHLGTALAILIYFYKEVLTLIKQGISVLKTRSLKGNWFFFNFCLATFVSVVFILVLKDLSSSVGRSSSFIAFNLIIFGIIMYLSDRYAVDESIDMADKSNLKKAFIIGLFQALAIFPGVSRSGITLTSARFMKVSREEASRFSFLLSLPIIFASIAYKAPAIFEGEATYVSFFNMSLGIVSSFLFGVLTIHFFLKFISQIGLLPFAIYRAIVGIILLIYL